jgi:hypothetical protein
MLGMAPRLLLMGWADSAGLSPSACTQARVRGDLNPYGRVTGGFAYLTASREE